jgi:hypothetical protein
MCFQSQLMGRAPEKELEAEPHSAAMLRGLPVFLPSPALGWVMVIPFRKVPSFMSRSSL